MRQRSGPTHKILTDSASHRIHLLVDWVDIDLWEKRVLYALLAYQVVLCNNTTTGGATRSFGREREREIRNPKWSFVGGREGELDKVTSKYVKSNAFGTKAEPAFSKQRTFLDWLAPRKHPKKGRV